MASDNLNKVYNIKNLFVGQLGMVNYLGEGNGSEWTRNEDNQYIIFEKNSDGLFLDVVSQRKYYYWKNINRNDNILKHINGETVIVNEQPLSLYFGGELITSQELMSFLSEINENKSTSISEEESLIRSKR